LGEPQIPLGVRSLRAAQLGDWSPKSASDEFKAVTLFSFALETEMVSGS
jgi:hypothetical protein